MPPSSDTGAGGGRVLAHRPPHEPIRSLNFRERVTPSLWYTPGLFVVGSLVVSKITVAIDRHRGADSAPSWLLGADADAAAALTATVAAAMLSFIAVVFSTTLVAIQLAGGQYSPRVVRIFVRSRLTHVTLGLFLATFVFALNALVEVRGGSEPLVPASTIALVYVLLAVTLVAFISFVHGMSRMLRVQYLLQQVCAEGRTSLQAAFGGHSGGVEIVPPAIGDAPVVRNRERVGVIQAIDRAALVQLARTRDAVIELTVEAGEYIGIGTPVARVTSGALTGDTIVSHFLLGAERTHLHDPGFVFRQLADVAARALSPGVNDATTAVQVIDRINDLLGGIAGAPDPSGWYVDADGAPRLHLAQPGLGRLIRLAYVETIACGAGSPQVVRRLRAAFEVLRPQLRPDVAGDLDDLVRMLDGAVAVSLPAPFRQVASVADRHGLG